MPSDRDRVPAIPQEREIAQAVRPQPARPAVPDPFEPESLRLGAVYAEGLGVRKVISTIPNRKPNKSEWFRVRPGTHAKVHAAGSQ